MKTQEKGIVASTYSVGVLYHIFVFGFSQDLQLKTWHCSSTFLFCLKMVLLGDWGEKFKYQLYGQND